MTRKQIDAAKEALYKKYYGDNPHTPDNLLQEWCEEDNLLEEELSCREMINSILIYGGNCDEDSYQYQKYLLPYIKGDCWHEHLLSKNKVAQLINEQKYDISQAEIGYAGEDCEGVSYNYCKFIDE